MLLIKKKCKQHKLSNIIEENETFLNCDEEICNSTLNIDKNYFFNDSEIIFVKGNKEDVKYLQNIINTKVGFSFEKRSLVIFKFIKLIFNIYEDNISNNLIDKLNNTVLIYN